MLKHNLQAKRSMQGQSYTSAPVNNSAIGSPEFNRNGRPNESRTSLYGSTASAW